ncbi:hypothetical protein H2509_00320 [Stappia sp. F7233]|uniref:Uncharacterized protein n=1 Tax=Stappia albiluteola TaxID=2758565 RepID=A0A839A9D1_9HYPH|nr:hypothetical protein [Stappia albiluteola]MBA5775562.1 hypothetical protein [Stappia albiluteola]
MLAKIGTLGGLMRMVMIAVLLVLPSLSQPHLAAVSPAEIQGAADAALVWMDTEVDGRSHTGSHSLSQAQCDEDQAAHDHDTARDDTCCYGLCFVADLAVAADLTDGSPGRDMYDLFLEGLAAQPVGRLYEPPIA